MRKVLLASTAVLLAGAASSHAANVNISASVTPSCTMTSPPGNIDFGVNPALDATLSSSFGVKCNFGGEGSPYDYDVNFVSANGGLLNTLDTTVRDYEIKYDGGAPFLASAAKPGPKTEADTSSAPGATDTKTFDVKLINALPVAGSYNDIVTVTVSV